MKHYTILATYKSRFDKIDKILINPTLEHVKRLYTSGHDILIEIYDCKGELKLTKKLLY